MVMTSPCCSGAACIALLADGSVEGDNLLCGLHGRDYRIQTGISEHNTKSWMPTSCIPKSCIPKSCIPKSCQSRTPISCGGIPRIQNNSALPKDRPGDPW